MLEIYFYHIVNGTIEEVLINLLKATRKKNWRALLCFNNEEKLNFFDKYLWDYSPDLVHGTTSQDYSAEQPILLSFSSENVNKSQICFLLDQTEYNKEHKFERIVVIFDGSILQEVEEARFKWQKFKELDANMYYYKQNEQSKWQLIKENVKN